MTIIFPIIFNIIAVTGLYLLEKKTAFAKIKNIYRQLIIGLIFGVIAILGSELGLKYSGVIVNVRDSAPLCAGLIFGWQAGLISGFIGGGYRALSVLWGAGTYTALACSVSTFLAGVIAALLRKFMFDNKKPTWLYAISITIVVEIFHMLMIFITNMQDTNTAFTFVRICTVPMALLNALTVGVSVIIVTLLSKERIKKEKGKEQIAQTFQRWLVVSILVAFVITSIFTYRLQTDMREKQIQDTFNSTISDVKKDIEGKSNATLLSIAKEVKKEYLLDTTKTSQDLLNLEKFNDKITDINLISSSGIVIDSTDLRNLENGGFDLSSADQPKEFMQLLNKEEDTFFVQGYQKNGFGERRKYAGITLPSDNKVAEILRGGIIQVSYNETQFHDNLDQFVIDFTKNRHVGANGFVAVCDENLNLVTETIRDNQPVSIIGIEPNKEMLNRVSASKIYTTNIINNLTDYKEEYLYVFTFAEEYCIIATLPEQEAMLIRDASAYLAIFMQILIFGALFVILYFLIKKLVIDNIHKINKTLSKISSGNLNERVNVNSNIEFASLSNDINTTVDTLKRYIKEADERIDKELEYAKKIQQSAIPSNYPKTNKFEIFAQMIAAKEVGGDFYDFYPLSKDTLAFLVADVSGKGIPAAMFMMTAKTIIKDLAERGLSVDEIFTIANQKLCENNDSGMFVTAWMGIFNIDTGKLSFANAGHNPPLIYQNGKFEYLKTKAGFVLGGLENVKYTMHELQFGYKDKIFLYTDGVTEATNKDELLYGEDRLLEFLNNNLDLMPKELLPKLKSDIDSFVLQAPQFDDITMLMLEYKNVQVTSKTFVAKVENLHQINDFLLGKLKEYNCTDKTLNSLMLVLEEVFVNVANYAYDNKVGNVKFSIEFDSVTRELCLEMVDGGKEFNPLEKADPDITLSAQERHIGGLGIFIVKKIMDRVNYFRKGEENVLTMIKKI